MYMVILDIQSGFYLIKSLKINDYWSFVQIIIWHWFWQDYSTILLLSACRLSQYDVYGMASTVYNYPIYSLNNPIAY